MITYLLKMVICSTLLFGYYRVALYNERFHHWNRFYLLASFIISIVAPLVSIPVYTHTTSQNIQEVMRSLLWNNNMVTAPTQSLSDYDSAVIFVAIVSFVFLVRFISHVIKLLFLHSSHGIRQMYNGVWLIITELPAAPFSFFNWLYWRKDIDPACAAGRRILEHEITHIREGHSYDKIFTSLVLCFFWMNPVFWLMRRELSTIHEFLADRKAIDTNDGAAFSEMILQALPLAQGRINTLVNPIFSSQIKRRLFMITKSNQPRYSYMRRVSALAFMCVLGIGLMFTVQKAEGQQKAEQVEATENASVKAKELEQEVAVQRQLVVAQVKETKKQQALAEQQKLQVAQQKKQATQQKQIAENNKISSKKQETINKNSATQASNQQKEPLYILDGKEISSAEMKTINTDNIKAVNVLKDESAIKKYGEKGRYGVVEISTKSNSEETASLLKVQVSEPVFFLNGKTITKEQVDRLDKTSIESIDVLKGEKAVEKYGEKAKNGAVEIKLKTTPK